LKRQCSLKVCVGGLRRLGREERRLCQAALPRQWVVGSWGSGRLGRQRSASPSAVRVVSCLCVGCHAWESVCSVKVPRYKRQSVEGVSLPPVRAATAVPPAARGAAAAVVGRRQRRPSRWCAGKAVRRSAKKRERRRGAQARGGGQGGMVEAPRPPGVGQRSVCWEALLFSAPGSHALVLPPEAAEVRRASVYGFMLQARSRACVKCAWCA